MTEYPTRHRCPPSDARPQGCGADARQPDVSARSGPAAAEYPERSIRLVVPQAPGSATDVLARILAAELEPQIGQSIVVENRPGGA